MTGFVPSPEQRAVIEHPLSPVRVAAGAGTGKTTTIAHRIGHFIASGLDPERILGITFTNKAADELASRVREVVGAAVDPGRDVEVHTYHGFAAHILHEFGPLVGVERDTGVITPTFGRQLFHDSLAGDFELLDVTWVGHLDRAVHLAGVISDNLLELDDLPTAVPSDPDDVWRARLEYLQIISGYEAEKRRLGVVDFGDLIAKAHRLVVRYPDFAQRIAQRYQAVLLDEYQDTNPAQRELLRALFGDGFPVTAVGDADQTIYEWRGASLENFERFPEHFSLSDHTSAPTLPLSLNRRSGQRILDLANQIKAGIDGSRERPDLQALPGTGPGTVAIRWLGTALDESHFIAERALELHAAGLQWRQMAVLFRKNKDIDTVRAALENHDIPVEVANLGGLLDIPEVADVFAWLRVLEDPADTPALLRLLMGSTYRLGMGDLKPLADWTMVADGNPDHPGVPRRSMTEALDHVEDAGPLRAEAVQALAAFRALYVRLVQVAQGVNLVELVRTILSETGAWPEIEAMPEAARISARLNLYRFLDLAEEWSPLEGRPSLAAFVGHLMLMAEDQTEELDTARLSGENAVALMTIHRAKGLEWDAVFLPAAYKGNFPMTGGTMDDPFRHAFLLPYDLRLDRTALPAISADMPEKDRSDLLRRRSLDQEWRIAYVGATRAKQHLTISGASWYGGPEIRKRPVQPGPLLEIATRLEGVIDLGFDEPPERPSSLRPEDTVGAPDPLFANGWQTAMRTTLSDPTWPATEARRLDLVRSYDQAVDEFEQMLFALPEPHDVPDPVVEVATSVTGLVTYATCPQRFFWSEVDRLPRRPSSAARRGVEVHRRIELHHRGAIPFDDLDDDLYDAIDSHEAPGPNAFAVFSASRFAEERPLHIEVPFDLRFDGATIRGRVDAIYQPEPGVWEIVDFKSGRPASNPANRLQLEAYAVAAAEGVFGAERPDRLSVTFAYLGGGELTEQREHVDETWMNRATSSLSSIIEGITGSDYTPTPGQACGSCDFLSLCEAGRGFLASQP